LKSNGLDRVAVENDNGELDGFLYLRHLTRKFVSQNYQLSSPIAKIVFKQIRKVTNETVLGLVSRILETDEFVAVVDNANKCIAVISHLDLLDFAAQGSNSVLNDSLSTASKLENISNGTQKMSIHSNGCTANGNAKEN